MSRAEFDMDTEDELLEIDLDELLDSLEFETTVPTEREAAAVAAAIATHRTDRALAAAEAAAESDPVTVSEWKLDGRMQANGVTHRLRPRHVAQSREWRAASRSL